MFLLVPRSAARRTVAWLFVAAAAVFGATAAQACTICLFAPEETAVDKVLTATDVVFAREDEGQPFRFATELVLKGSADGDPIPFLVDSATRRKLAAEPEAAVLMTRRGGTWERLLTADAAMRSVIETIVAEGLNWMPPAGAERRFAFFADLHDHPSDTIRRLALAEIDRAPYRFVRTLSLRLPRAEVRAELGKLTEVAWLPVRLRLLSVDAQPEDVRLVRSRFAAASRARSAIHIQALAEALVAIDGADGVAVLRDGYGEAAARSANERMAVARALAIHISDGDPALRPRAAAALRSILAAEPSVAPLAVKAAPALGKADRIALAGDLRRILAEGVLTAESDRFAVVSFLMMIDRAPDATAGSEAGREHPAPALATGLGWLLATVASLGAAGVLALRRRRPREIWPHDAGAASGSSPNPLNPSGKTI